MTSLLTERNAVSLSKFKYKKNTLSVKWYFTESLFSAEKKVFWPVDCSPYS